LRTVGYGHRIFDNEKFDKPLTNDQGLALLKRDIDE